MRGILTLLLLLFAPPMLMAQEVVERLLAEVEGEEEADRLGSWLTERLAQPIDLNHATEDELLEVPFFDAFFVRNLLLERSRRGGSFRSIYELKEVSGAPLQILPLLEPFLTLSAPEKRVERRLKQSLFGGAEVPLPRQKVQYRGVGWGTSYSGSVGGGARGLQSEWSLAAERDRGEPRLVDYLSLSYQWSSRGQTIYLGDFRVGSGLGLLLGQSLSFYSSAELSGRAPEVMRRSIRRHQSFRERL